MKNPETELKFQKWHGCRNDFLVADCGNQDEAMSLWQPHALALCSKKGDGIGADGLLFISKDQGAYRLGIINSDGSIAETCGNGIRCAAGYINEKYGPIDVLTLILRSGAKAECRLRQNAPLMVTVAMAAATAVTDDSYGVRGPLKALAAQTGLNLLDQYGVYNTLNDHIVLEPGTEVAGLAARLGPPLQRVCEGAGINVHIIEPKALTSADKQIAHESADIELGALYKVVTWERGAGETMACGSGACAVAAYHYDRNPKCHGLWIGIDMPGGRLYILRESSQAPLLLLGPAEHVYDGIWRA